MTVWRAGLVAVALAAGCGGTSPGAPPASGSIQGVPISAFSCRVAAHATGSGEQVQPGAVTEFRLCPLQQPVRQPGVTLRPGDNGFSALQAALAEPDEARTNQVCPEYADVVQTVLARTTAAAYVVHIPVDSCGHYQRDALTAIQQGRMRDTASRRS